MEAFCLKSDLVGYNCSRKTLVAQWFKNNRLSQQFCIITPIPLPLNRQTGICECLTTNNVQQVKKLYKNHPNTCWQYWDKVIGCRVSGCAAHSAPVSPKWDWQFYLLWYYFSFLFCDDLQRLFCCFLRGSGGIVSPAGHLQRLVYIDLWKLNSRKKTNGSL